MWDSQTRQLYSCSAVPALPGRIGLVSASSEACHRCSAAKGVTWCPFNQKGIAVKDRFGPGYDRGLTEVRIGFKHVKKTIAYL